MVRVPYAIGRVVAVIAVTIGAWAAPARAQNCIPFTDVLASSSFCGNIQWLFNRGITQGCTATQYCPANFVRRDQMAAFLNRLADDLFPLNCAAGQVMKWNGTAWTCAGDAAGPANAFVQGGNAFGATAVLGTGDAQPLHIEAGGGRVVRYEPNTISPNVVGGSPANSVTAGVRGATIAGGGVPSGNTDPAFDGEAPNRVTDAYGSVGGGLGNRAGNDSGGTTDGSHATVGGGHRNTAGGPYTTVGGGFFNTASGASSTVGGGASNEASNAWATVGGGFGNIASGTNSAVPGGFGNEANGDNSIAMGNRAVANGNGSFSFADSNPFDFVSTNNNVVRVRATGGARFVVDIDGTGTSTWRCDLDSGSNWTCSSDRNLKQNLVPLDGRAVLTRLASMPVYAWNPRGRNAHVLHYGPTAQDFKAAFGLGDDETMIGMQDANGVALAAIQGLQAKLEEQSREMTALRDAYAAEIADLRATLHRLLERSPLLRE